MFSRLPLAVFLSIFPIAVAAQTTSQPAVTAGSVQNTNSHPTPAHTGWATLAKDTGFQGYEPAGVLTRQPKKNRKARS